MERERNAKIYFDGRYNSGYLDVDLVPVNGDSLVLLYRKDAAEDWTLYPYYTKTTISPTLAYGWMTIDSLLLGDYAFANGDLTVGVNQAMLSKKDIKVYPNPSDSFVMIESIQPLNNTTVHLYDLTGKLVAEERLINKTRIETSELTTQTYILMIVQDGKSIYNQKVIIN